MVTGVNIIAIYVTDLECSLDFYRDKLGLIDSGEMGPGYMLKAGEISVYLEASRKSSKVDAMTNADVTICFSTKSVKHAYEVLSSGNTNVTMNYVEYSDEFAMFMVADPDGNIVEFAGTP